MGLRPDLVLFPLDNELVVFSEQTQRLIGLNASAALVFRELQKGSPVSQLAEVLVSEGRTRPQEAEGWVKTTLDGLASQGLLADCEATAGSSAEKPEEDQRLA